MITKRDILDRAREWQLRPDVVEKDYVLGWVLAGTALDEDGSRWIFKGGTCIKKCFFETYRFSEDLDFTLLPSAPYAPNDIEAFLASVAGRVQDLSGVVVPRDQMMVRQRSDRQGRPTFEARLGYRRPLAIPGGYPRIRFDITRHEPVVDRPVRRPIFHPYPDALPEGARVRTYSFHELLAEKVRALYERARPRDLYDVVFLLENPPEGLDLFAARRIFLRKCRAKELSPPACDALAEALAASPELEAEWANMLAHQLPLLPALEDLLPRVRTLLQWIDIEEVVRPAPALAPAAPATAGDLVSPGGMRYWGLDVPLETIRFAGASRLLLDFEYHGKARIVEPYSLRRPQTGNILLYAYDPSSAQIKAFNLDKISGLRATAQRFEPRYIVEFGPSGSLVIPSTKIPARPVTGRRRSAGSRRERRYIFECPYCQKRLWHVRNNPRLSKHKTKDGWPCAGRNGVLVETR